MSDDVTAEAIREHFKRFLGADISVDFPEPESPRSVVLYRPDRLSDSFVTEAYEALAASAPAVARQIERLAVSFETRLGRTRRRIALPTNEVTIIEDA
ncbi:MAG: hypothetical protein AB7P20_03135 [Rhizobiaceae bacterium]